MGIVTHMMKAHQITVVPKLFTESITPRSLEGLSEICSANESSAPTSLERQRGPLSMNPVFGGMSQRMTMNSESSAKGSTVIAIIERTREPLQVQAIE
jgi:hypothetical protein